MMRARIWMLCLVAVVAGAGVGVAGQVDVQDMLPADAIVAMCYYGDNTELEQTEIYKLLEEPEVKQWLTSLRQTLVGANQLAAAFLKVNPAQIRPLLGSQVGVAVLPRAGAAAAAGPPELLLVAKVGGADAPTRQGLAGFLQQLQALAPQGAEQLQVAGMAATRLGGGPMAMLFGFRGDYFVLGSSQAVLEQALKEGGAKLSGVAGFQRAKELGGSPVAVVLYNHAAVMERFGMMAPPEALAVMQDLGLNEVRSAGFRLAAKGRAMVGTLFVRTGGERRGLLKVLASAPVDRELLKLVPRDASVAWVTNLDVAALYDTAVAVAQTAGAAQGVNPRQEIARFEAEAGMSLRNDLVGSLGRGTVVTTSAPSLLPALIVSQAVADGDKLEQALGKLVVRLDAVIKAQAGEQAGAAIRSIEFRNHAIRYLATPGVPVPVAPCYCRVGDRVVVGLSPIHLKDYLLFLDGNEPSILERPGYKAMAGVVPAEATSISYSDFAEAVVGTYQTFGPMLTMAQGIPRNPIAIDLANMPAARTVRKHLFGALSYTVTTDDMVVYQCESPVGVGFVGGVPTVAMAAIGAGMLLPALASARGAARGAVSMNNLKQVGVAAMMYANDHDNQLPPNLAALFDGNLLPDDKILLAPNDRAPPRTVGNRPCSYVYLLDRHKGLKLKLADIERPAMVPLAWERESFGRGRRNVLFIDGHVQAMQEADFARRMERVQNFLAKKAKEQKGEF